MTQEIKEHYKELFKAHGDSTEAVQQVNQDTQYRRFKALAEIDPDLTDVVDIGCGLGHLYEFLRQRNFQGTYLGTDFVSEMVTFANEKFAANPNVRFEVVDMATAPTLPTGDYLLLSGVFNNVFPNGNQLMLDVIGKMFAACRKGIAFNHLSSYVDYQDPHLAYSNPCEIFDYCKRNLSKRVTLRHDYLLKDNILPYEYTLYIYK